MNNDNDLDVIKGLVRGAGHVPPRVEILKSELRSDSGFEVPIPPMPVANYLLIRWSYQIPTCDLDPFHAFLNDHEDLIISDTEDLAAGVAYLGTYAEMPGGNLHHTFWSYDSLDAIADFQVKLGEHLQLDLRNRLREMASRIKDPAMSMQRMVRAKALHGLVATQRETDPILDMFAGGE